MHILPRWLFAGFALFTATLASAETAPAFSIPEKQIEVAWTKTLQRTKQVILTTSYLEVMNWGKISSVTQTSALQTLGGASNSTARSTLEVAVPANVPAYRAVSAALYTDLVTKLRAAGWEVSTYDDVKAEPAVAGLPLDKVDATLGAPLREVKLGKQKMQYAVVAPEGMPVIKAGFLSPLWDLRSFVNKRGANALLVFYRFDPVALQGQSKHGLGSNTASTKAEANLVLSNAQGIFITPKGDLGFIRTKSAVPVIGGVGEIQKAADVSPNLANGISKGLSFLGGGSISSQKGLYVCLLNQAALDASLLLAGQAFNDEIVRNFGAAPK